MIEETFIGVVWMCVAANLVSKLYAPQNDVHKLINDNISLFRKFSSSSWTKNKFWSRESCWTFFNFRMNITINYYLIKMLNSRKKPTTEWWWSFKINRHSQLIGLLLMGPHRISIILSWAMYTVRWHQMKWKWILSSILPWQCQFESVYVEYGQRNVKMIMVSMRHWLIIEVL